MAEGVVVVYLSRLGGRLSSHQEIMLDADAKVIAELLGYKYSGYHCATQHYADHVFFVPDDTLLQDEALSLGIARPTDLYGGVVPHPFVKTKAITHQLVDDRAKRPDGSCAGTVLVFAVIGVGNFETWEVGRRSR